MSHTKRVDLGKSEKNDTPCFCDSGLSYQDCCQPILSGAELPVTAKALMRSRYSAYCQAMGEYLLRTQAPETRKELTAQMLKETAEQQHWMRLDVLSHQAVSPDQAMVEFKAYQLIDGYLACLHEKSLFRLDGDQWLYVSGDIQPTDGFPIKIGRNETCPCGSGAKFKRCCARTD